MCLLSHRKARQGISVCDQDGNVNWCHFSWWHNQVTASTLISAGTKIEWHYIMFSSFYMNIYNCLQKICHEFVRIFYILILCLYHFPHEMKCGHIGHKLIKQVNKWSLYFALYFFWELVCFHKNVLHFSLNESKSNFMWFRMSYGANME